MVNNNHFYLNQILI